MFKAILFGMYRDEYVTMSYHVVGIYRCMSRC